MLGFCLPEEPVLGGSHSMRRFHTSRKKARFDASQKQDYSAFIESSIKSSERFIFVLSTRIILAVHSTFIPYPNRPLEDERIWLKLKW